jgi:hypothetical protein
MTTPIPPLEMKNDRGSENQNPGTVLASLTWRLSIDVRSCLRRRGCTGRRACIRFGLLVSILSPGGNSQMATIKLCLVAASELLKPPSVSGNTSILLCMSSLPRLAWRAGETYNAGSVNRPDITPWS